ncbi:Gfo/Idh/MocA family protein [Desulfosarcina ovata]|uniref:Gfo/Idh/MocA-like oxidoreductase N-terminal domain-containing protein n=1 Tax=Desulfosarcina ovata subsp. ovata TaxID=2752305 RepID=A0A5K8A5K9_9BACT|nr:Gfo/Idh/MocA family oxidoreductase [Desulfosarcina ovata]BBO87787.1 hypothetical protein DSCOOX_09670 [Desulfosarcina ovata subsp. ovata]
MNVAVIGAGRTNNGIGRFIGKFFQKHGANVSAVLGSTDESARKAAEALEHDGRVPRSYTKIDTLTNKECPDIAVIASPTNTHLPYLKACIDAGLHIFCEKPFIDPATPDILGCLDKIFQDGEHRRLTIAMNSQCPFLQPVYERFCGQIRPEAAVDFSIALSPMVDGQDMIPDSVPHALSLIYNLLGNGEIGDLRIEKREGQITILGIYRAHTTDCNFKICLNRHLQQPRPFSFGWNHCTIHRRVTLKPYEISFQYEDTIRKVADPLELSVQNFIASVQKQEQPKIGRTHIVDTTLLIKRIFDHWESSE